MDFMAFIGSKPILCKPVSILQWIKASFPALQDTADINCAASKQADAEALCAELQEKYPSCDVEAMYGGQPLYYYLLSVE